eukprot:4888063-Amphidinium_carterae.1
MGAVPLVCEPCALAEANLLSSASRGSYAREKLGWEPRFQSGSGNAFMCSFGLLPEQFVRL